MIITWVALLFQGFICFLLQDASWFQDNIALVSMFIILFTSCIFVMEMLHKYDGKIFDFASLVIIFVGYFLRIFLIYWDLNFRHIFVLPSSGFDTEGFFRVAAGLTPGTYRYSAYMSHVFDLFGVQRPIGQFINVLLGITCAFIAIKIAKKLTSDRNTIHIVLVLGMLLPYFMILNSIFLREALITFYLTASLYFFVLWFVDKRLWAIPAAMLFVGLAVFHHSGAVAPIVGYALCMAFYSHKSKSFRLNMFTIVRGAIGLSIVYGIDHFLGGALLGRFLSMDVAFLTRFAEAETGGSAYTIFVHTGIENLDFIINTPIRMIYFILSPLPWYWRNPFDIIAFFLSSLVYGYTYFISIKTLLRKERGGKDAIIMLFIISIIGVFIFGWGVRNTGTAMRHRDKFLMYHILLLALSVRREALFKTDINIKRKLSWLAMPTN